MGALLRSARDIKRKDKGLNGYLDRLPLPTWIIFLKFLDDLELGGIGLPAFSGAKARHVTARPEGPGCRVTKISQGLKGRSNLCAAHAPPLQGGGICLGTLSRGFTPGCHITGFQPADHDPVEH